MIQQRCIKLIKSDSKDFYNITKDFYFKNAVFLLLLFFYSDLWRIMWHWRLEKMAVENFYFYKLFLKMLKCILISQFYYSYSIFDQINAALVNMRLLSKTFFFKLQYIRKEPS